MLALVLVTVLYDQIEMEMIDNKKRQEKLCRRIRPTPLSRNNKGDAAGGSLTTLTPLFQHYEDIISTLKLELARLRPFKNRSASYKNSY